MKGPVHGTSRYPTVPFGEGESFKNTDGWSIGEVGGRYRYPSSGGGSCEAGHPESVIEEITTTIGGAKESMALAAKYVEMLERAGRLNDQQGRVLRRIREKVDEGTATVGWLETIARGGPQHPQIRPLVLEGEVSRAVGRAAAMAERADAKVLVRPAERVRAYADAEILGRVLDNLLNNAITYSEGRPWVVVEIGTEPTPFIRVSDAGIGLTPETGRHIFERSFRADPDNSDRPGSGIGLHFSRQAAEQMGGWLVLESTALGSGSIFRLDLRPV